MEFNEVVKTEEASENTIPIKSNQRTGRGTYPVCDICPYLENSQTARYYCALDGKGREAVANCLQGTNKDKTEGAALIVATFVKNRSGFDREGNPDNECGNGWGYYDLGIATQNLVLKAQEMGLGTLIMGIRDGEALRNVLSVPENEIIVSVIAVGYSAEQPIMPKRKNVDDITKWF